MKTDRERRQQARDDAASAGRLQQRRDEWALKRLFLVILATMLAIAAIGYALAIWWDDRGSLSVLESAPSRAKLPHLS
jgi:hypothetical protein